jgi:hypothetical protein
LAWIKKKMPPSLANHIWVIFPSIWLIMVIELSGVQFGLKINAWLQIAILISVQNCTKRSSISTLLYSFWNLEYFCKPETFLFAKDTPPVPPRVLVSFVYKYVQILQKS